MSPFAVLPPTGGVITRVVNPLPAPVKNADVVPPPTNNSFAADVVTEPLLTDVDEPDADADLSNGAAVSRPLYSKTRTSENCTAGLNDTVTVFDPAADALMFAA